MNVHRRLLWPLIALFVLLSPRVARAFEDQGEDSELRDRAKELQEACETATSRARQHQKYQQEALDKLLNDMKAEKASIADADPAAPNQDWFKKFDEHLEAATPDIDQAIQAANQHVAPETIAAWKERSAAAKSSGLVDEICSAYCSSESVAATHIDVCAFANDVALARVATAVDPIAAEEVLEKLAEIGVGTSNAAEDRGGTGWRIPGGGALAGVSLTDLAVRFATALGKLAIDRAQQEAVLWALGEIGDRFCGNGNSDELATAEIRTQWLPQTCRLATEENLQSGFGAGQAMLRALVSAVESDAKHLPGAAAGLIVGVAYWSEDTGTTTDADMGGVFRCNVASDTDPKRPECQRLLAVRSSTSGAIGGLLDGKDPVDVARTWSADIDETNRIPLEGGGDRHVLAAPLAQLTACGVAVAAELGADPEHRTVPTPEGQQISEHYHVIGALVSAPACWTLTGQGWRSTYSKPTDEKCGDKKEDQCLALDRTKSKSLERLTTIIRLNASFKESATQARDAWRDLQAVARRLRDARERFGKAVKDAADVSTFDATEATLAAVSKLGTTDLELDDLRSLLDEAKLDRVKDRLTAALDVADELLAAADSTAALLEAHSDGTKFKGLFPGLQEQKGAGRGFPDWVAKTNEIAEPIAGFRAKLDRVGELTDALREILAGDWALASSKALAAVQDLFPTKAKKKTKRAGKTAGYASTVVEDLQSRAKEFDRLLVLREDAKQRKTEADTLRAEAKTLRKEADTLEAEANTLRAEAKDEEAKAKDEVAVAKDAEATAKDEEATAKDAEAKVKETEVAAAEAERKKNPAKSQSLSDEASELRRQARSVERLLRQDKTERSELDVARLSELIGLVTSLLSAEDSDDMAEILEKTASPPGSWRRKQAAGAFTLSVGAHVGVYTAAEFRDGQYGVVLEKGAPHVQAPTLSVPIGLDFAWGTGRNSLGFFLPVIDPAAFLQYDVESSGRLPGPQPITVLSPGAMFRWGIFRTPITVLLGYVYRPRFRTWEAAANDPGADAHQIGASLAIDATFWNIVKR